MVDPVRVVVESAAGHAMLIMMMMILCMNMSYAWHCHGHIMI